MSNLSRFLKDNKIKKENTTYAATKSLVDEKGSKIDESKMKFYKTFNY